MSPFAPCPAEEEWLRLLRAQPSAEEAERLAQHLEGCGRCADALDRMLGADQLSEALRAPAAAARGVEDRVVESLTDRLRQLHPLARPILLETTPGQSLSVEGPFPPVEMETYDFLAPAEGPGELGRLGPYRVLGVLGQGGMGVVFLAEDLRLRRQVALKVMRPAVAALPAARARFLREGRAAAAIEHEHVVAIHHVGEDRGVPFLAMQLLRGETLEDRLRRDGRLPLAEALRVGREVAAGLAAAHARGLIHRDIKPANVWLESGTGRVKLVDFGLARAAIENVHLTQTGTILGTPGYMAPEQARGKAVDVRCDLFSLGCVLYRMCYGEAPFTGKDRMSTLLAVVRHHPRPPRQARPAVPRELAQLIEHLLAKSPDRRPPSAQEVVEALEGIEHPTRARSRRPRRRWLRAAVAAGVLLAAVGAITWGLVVRDRPGAGGGPADDAVRVPPRPPARKQAGEVLRLEGHTGPVLSLAWLPDGRRALSAGQDGSLRLWDRQTGKQLRVFRGHAHAEIQSVAVSADGCYAVSGGWDKTVRLWDLDSGKQLRTFAGHQGAVLGVAFSPDGRQVLSGGLDKTLRLWDVATGKEVRKFEGHTDGVTQVAFSPDGRRAASGCVGPSKGEGRWGRGQDNAVRLWDVATGQEVRKLEGHPHHVWSVAFSPDGRQLLSGGEDGSVRLWDVATGNELRRFEGHTRRAHSVAFSWDGRRALSASGDQTARLSDVETGRRLYRLEGHEGGALTAAFSPDGRYALSGGADRRVRLWRLPAPPPPEQAAEVRRIPWGKASVSHTTLSPDGTLYAAGSDAGELRLYEVATGKQVHELTGHGGALQHVAFAPDGKQVLTASMDKTLRLWDVASGKEVRKFEGHTEGVQSVAVLPDGQRALSGGNDKTVRLWQLATGKQVRKFEGHTGAVLSVTVSPDGKQVLSTGADKTVRLWDVETGQELRSFEGHSERLVGAVFLPGGKQLASYAFDKTLRAWDVASGKEVRKLDLGDNLTDRRSVAISPDGRRFLTTHRDNTVRLRDLASGEEWQRFAVANSPWGVSFSPDGRYAASGSDHGLVFLFRLPATPPEQFREARRFVGHQGRVGDVALSPDGRLALTAGGGARLWDVASGKELRTFGGHTSNIQDLTFLPDGQRFLSSSRDGTVRLWDVAKGKEIRRLDGHRGQVWGARVSPDGKRALTACHDGLLRLFDIESGKELRRWKGHAAEAICVELAPDGRRALSGGWDDTVRLWDVEKGQELLQLPFKSRRVAFSPDGKQALFQGPDNSLLLWDLEANQEVRRLEGHRAGIYGLAFTADGRHAVSAGGDQTVRLWHLGSGQERACFLDVGGEVYGMALSTNGREVLMSGSWSKVPKLLRLPESAWPVDKPGEVRRFEGHKDFLGARLSPDGRLAVTAGGGDLVGDKWLPGSDFAVRLWDVGTGRELRRFEGHTATVFADFSPDGRRVLTASADKTWCVWDAATGTRLRKVECADGLGFAAWAPDGKRVLIASGNAARLFDAGTGKELRTFKGHRAHVESVAFAPDGKRALSSSFDGKVRVWEVEADRKPLELGGGPRVRQAVWSPDGRYLLSCGADRLLHLWDAESGKEVRRFEGHTHHVESVAFTPDGKRAVSGSCDGTMRLWDVASGAELQRFEGFQKASSHKTIVHVQVSPDGRYVLLSGWDKTARLWRLPDAP
jgi:WD40 repeat protein